MRPITVALAISDTELRADVHAELSAHPVRLVLDQACIESLQLLRLNLDLVLVDSRPEGETLETLIRRIKTHAPQVAVAVVSRVPDSERILEAMRGGADEFILPPFEHHMRAAIERLFATLSARETSHRTNGKVIGFLSAKGGCGASSIAAHVATALERTAGSDILLADFDLESGLIGFLTQPKTTYTILDALHNVHRMDVGFWKRLVGTVRPRLDVIPSPLTTLHSDPPKREDFNYIFRLARSLYGWVLVDLGRGMNAVTVNLLEEFDELCLVTTPHVASLYQAKQAIARLGERGFSRTSLRLILNRAPRKNENLAADVQKCLGVPVYAQIQERPEIEDAYSDGRLMALDSPMGQEFAALASRLADVPVASEKASKGWSLFGLRKPAAESL